MNSRKEVHEMTLAEVLPSARLLSATEKLKLIRILAEDLDMAEDISPLEPFKTYDLPTPYDSSNRRIPTHGISIRLVKKFQRTTDFGSDELFSRIRCLLLPLYVRI
jgi:hypothetical protein